MEHGANGDVPEPPERVGPYRIESRLGMGGMGAVYRAYDQRLERPVAIKHVLPDAAEGTRARDRLRREARAVASLNHPAIVQIYDIVEMDDGDWIVMELVEGQSLHRLVERGPIELTRAVTLGREIAEGLAEAHSKGIVHRDLKTENVMITLAGHAKILDFGLAKRLWHGQGDASLSVQGSIMGTSRAMSPEQAMGDPVDHRSDLFSLGTLLYEMVTGKPPFLGSSIFHTLAQVCSERHTPVHEIDPHIPKQLSRLIDHLLEKNPSDRPRSARRVATVLAGLEADLGPASGTIARPPSAVFTPPSARHPGAADEETETELMPMGGLPPTASHPRLPSPADPQRGSLSGLFVRSLVGSPQRRVIFALALLVLLVLTVGLLRIRTAAPLPETVPSTAPATRSSVAVLGFRNLSDRAETAWLGTALAEMLATELAAGERLRLIPGESVARMRLELGGVQAETLASDTLSRVGRMLGCDYVVLGSYLGLEQDGEKRLRIQLWLQDTDTGETLASFPQVGAESEIFELVSRAGTRLREELAVGEPPRRVARAVRAAMPSSPEATRLYSLGLSRLRGFDALMARDTLLEAVEIEPGFALAHAALSEAWKRLGYDREAADSAARAFELASDLPREDYLRIEGLYHEAAGEWEEATATYQALLRFFPDSVDYGLMLAKTQITGGQGAAALATVEQLQALPLPIGEDPRIDLMEGRAAYALLDYGRDLEASRRAQRKGEELEAQILVAEALQRQGTALMFLGELDEAERALAEAERLFSAAGGRGQVADVIDTRALVRLAQGELAETEKLHRQALAIYRETGNRKAVSTVLNNLALLYLVRGELATSEELLEQAVGIARELNNRDIEARYLDTMAWVALHQGKLTRAEDLARRELEAYEAIGSVQGRGWSYFYLGQVALARGELSEARSLHERALEIAHEGGNQSQLAYVTHGLGEVLLATGDFDGADRRLEAAEALRSRLGERGPWAETRALRARLLLDRGRPGEAEALAREAAASFAELGVSDEETRARSLLAAALLAQGELEQARRADESARARGERSQNPAVRLATAVTAARVAAAAGEREQAERLLVAAEAESARLGMVAARYEARLALAELELARDPDIGRATVAALAREAEEAGFGSIGARARRALE